MLTWKSLAMKLAYCTLSPYSWISVSNRCSHNRFSLPADGHTLRRGEGGMLPIRWIWLVLKSELALTVASSFSSWSVVNFKRKDCIIHVPSGYIPGMNEWITFASKELRKQQKYSALRLQSLFICSFQVNTKNLGNCACTSNARRVFRPIFRALRNEAISGTCGSRNRTLFRCIFRPCYRIWSAAVRNFF